MSLAASAMALAWVASGLGLLLFGYRLFRHRPSKIAGWAHPLLGVAAIGWVYATVIFRPGPRSLPFDVGALVLTLTLLGGGLLFALRLTRVPRPVFVIVVHGAAALLGCSLLVVGLLH
jgi:hypothetical protein